MKHSEVEYMLAAGKPAGLDTGKMPITSELWRNVFWAAFGAKTAPRADETFDEWKAREQAMSDETRVAPDVKAPASAEVGTGAVRLELPKRSQHDKDLARLQATRDMLGRLWTALSAVRYEFAFGLDELPLLRDTVDECLSDALEL